MDSTTRKIIKKLNELRAYELRQSNLYRIAAQMVTGPARDATVEEFQKHSEEEAHHADLAMSRIMGLGGDIDSNVLEVPVFRNLDQILRGIEEFEEDGIKYWQELMDMLPEDDSFRHTVEGILETETEHYNDIKIFLRRDYMAKSNGPPVIRPLNWVTPTNIASDPFMNRGSNWLVQSREQARAGTPPTIISGAVNGNRTGLSPVLPVTREMNPKLIMKSHSCGSPSCKKCNSDIGDKLFGKDTKDLDKGDYKIAKSKGAARSKMLKEKHAQAKLMNSLKRVLRTQLSKKPFAITKFPSIHRSLSKVKYDKLFKAMQGVQANPLLQQAPPSIAANPWDNSNINVGEPPIGTTANGAPIYSDPYHKAHQSFGPQDHENAASIHDQSAEDMMQQGKTINALGAQQKANIHRMLLEQMKSPSDRAFERMMDKNREQNPMDKLLDQNKDDRAARIGPKPGMMNTFTGEGTGMQTGPNPMTRQSSVANTPSNYDEESQLDFNSPEAQGNAELPAPMTSVPGTENQGFHEMSPEEEPDTSEYGQESEESAMPDQEEPMQSDNPEDEEEGSARFQKAMKSFYDVVKAIKKKTIIGRGKSSSAPSSAKPKPLSMRDMAKLRKFVGHDRRMQNLG